MFRKLFLAATFVWLLIFFTGCLTSESKEYRFKVNPDGTGSGTITFVNIVSKDDAGKDVSMKDFGDLVTNYLEGSGFEDANPHYQVTGKRLYEKDGKLMGEVTFTLASFDSIGFFRQPGCECCPTILYIPVLDETYAESNGKYLGETAATPLVVWAPGTKELYVKTKLTEDSTNTHSLLADWQDWKSKGQKDKD